MDGVRREDGIAEDDIFYPSSAQPDSLTMMLMNDSSINRKSLLIHDIIVDEDIDLACICETWLGEGRDGNLTCIGLLVFCMIYRPMVGEVVSLESLGSI